MTKEFNLSDKMWTSPLSERNLYTEEDVKEFIKRLKEEIKDIDFNDFGIYHYESKENRLIDYLLKFTNTLAGDKLI